MKNDLRHLGVDVAKSPSHTKEDEEKKFDL
jgi:hypothetical protein